MAQNIIREVSTTLGKMRATIMDAEQIRFDTNGAKCVLGKFEYEVTITIYVGADGKVQVSNRYNRIEAQGDSAYLGIDASRIDTGRKAPPRARQRIAESVLAEIAAAARGFRAELAKVGAEKLRESAIWNEQQALNMDNSAANYRKQAAEARAKAERLDNRHAWAIAPVEEVRVEQK